MGTLTRIVLYDADHAHAEAAAAAAFARIAQIDGELSDYHADSEAMRLCAAAGGPPRPVSEDFFQIFTTAQNLARESDGAFDVTIGPLVALWRTARATGAFPAQADLARARALSGWRLATLDPAARTLTLAKPGMKLDFGGIGKGFAAGEAVRVLRQRGCNACLVGLAGDIVVGDAPPAGAPAGWRIDIAHEPGVSLGSLRLANAAVSTSGDTQQFVIIDGRRYSHVIDPRTGIGVTSRIAATVVAPTGSLADGLCKPICVLGPGPGGELVARHAGAAAIISRLDEPGRPPIMVDPAGVLRFTPASTAAAASPAKASP